MSVEQSAPTVANGKIKIGAVAKHFEISVDLLRLYEREGLLIPIKSSKGTRYFMEKDYEWIGTLLHLVRTARLNFAGIRHLLALLPCWEIQGCGFEKDRSCPVTVDGAAPCWMNRGSCTSQIQCYDCAVYRSAPACQNLKALLVKSAGFPRKAATPVNLEATLVHE